MAVVPEVLKTYDYEAILSAHINDVQNIVPDYQPAEGDLLMIEKEASAYRELHLRAEFNQLARAFFLATASEKDLDAYAEFYGVERLQGAKPTAEYFFSLTSRLDYQQKISKDTVLVDSGGQYLGILLEDIVFEIGEDEKVGLVELQEFISSSTVELSILQTPLPFVNSVEAKTAFNYGADIESDESFRNRILISMADKSTAGSKMSYESYTYGADARIEDVKVFNALNPIESYIDFFVDKNRDETVVALNQFVADFCTVKVIIYAPTDVVNTSFAKVEEALNNDNVRPLTDFVKVQRAKEVLFDVVATIFIFPKQDQNAVYISALESLKSGLESLKKIDVDITASEINNFLHVEGVKKVEIHNDLNINIDRESIGILRDINLQREVYYEQL